MNWGFLGVAVARAVFGPGATKASKASASRKPSPLSYSSQGPSGQLHYSRDGKRFSFHYEFGGGDALALISIPKPQDWVPATGIPLEQREEMLNFIARQVIADQTSTGQNRYEIGEDHITIFEL